MKMDNLFKDVNKDFELEIGFTQVDILDVLVNAKR